MKRGKNGMQYSSAQCAWTEFTSRTRSNVAASSATFCMEKCFMRTRRPSCLTCPAIQTAHPYLDLQVKLLLGDVEICLSQTGASSKRLSEPTTSYERVEGGEAHDFLLITMGVMDKLIAEDIKRRAPYHLIARLGPPATNAEKAAAKALRDAVDCTICVSLPTHAYILAYGHTWC